MEKNKTTFEALGLDPAVLDALREMNYEVPTSIQEKAIPIIIEGKDLIALAETGSGKTAACSIPICQRVQTESVHIQALIIVPTRELALQYASETQKIGKFRNVRAFALFGGEDMHLQREKLKSGVHILIATPGRLIDFIYARHIDLTHVEILVLDEADQMLGMGFIEDLEFIINCLIHSHSTLLFSATMPPQIRKLAETYMQKPAFLSLIDKKSTPENLTHQFVFCRVLAKKKEELVTLLKRIEPTQCLIFVNSRVEVESLFHFLKKKFASVDFLHGGLDQNIRTIITTKFSKGKIRYLIATDIAARGLDFSQVTHVINFHFPREEESYIHRSGRTGRAGRSGACITLVTSREVKKVERLMHKLNKPLEWVGASPNAYNSHR